MLIDNVVIYMPNNDLGNRPITRKSSNSVQSRIKNSRN